MARKPVRPAPKPASKPAAAAASKKPAKPVAPDAPASRAAPKPAPATKPASAAKARPVAKPPTPEAPLAPAPAAPTKSATPAAKKAPRAAAIAAPAPTAAPAPAPAAAPAPVADVAPAVVVPPEAPKKAPAAKKAKAAPPAGVAEASAAAPARPAAPVVLPPRREDGTITVAHSPDADDAFMFYALANGKVDTETRRYEHVLKDIQTLNEEAKKGTYDVTALSFHAYPYVRQNYSLLPCGASFGDGYGPILVAKTPIRANEVEGMKVAVPGLLTTAALVARMWFARARVQFVPVPFDKVGDVVKAGLVRAGVIIHEGQLMWKEQKLVRVLDFGQWWSERTEGLPLPLGGNGIRRDIPKELGAKISLDLKRSIAYALGHREEALAYAMQFGRNLPKEKADKFVGMYVNELTLDYGERGRQALQYLYDRAHEGGFLAEHFTADFVG